MEMIGYHMKAKIPLSFEFRKTVTDWIQGTAHFTGWARREDGTVDGDNLLAEIKHMGRRVYRTRYPRKNLPKGRWDGLGMQAYSDAGVERLLSTYEPLLLVPWGKTYVEQEDLRNNSQSADAWQLRSEFLRLKPTPDQAIEFLSKWGPWNSDECFELPEIIRLQQAIRKAVTNSPDGWFASEDSLPSTWCRCPEYPYFLILTYKVEVALRMTVTLDLLDQAKFMICERPDCGQPFKVKSKHTRMYCSRTCTHVEAVRRSRKAASGK
jgi:hypothetical protein